jgi:hypothetical protein
MLTTGAPASKLASLVQTIGQCQLALYILAYVYYYKAWWLNGGKRGSSFGKAWWFNVGKAHGGSMLGRRGGSMVACQTVVLQSWVRIRRLPSPQLTANLLVGCHLGWHLAAG